ncbi:MAG: NADPH:quinone reductase-like Zn-dependent oxidoreductase [Pseudohongiellaceae bacterium]|jgi:NADPH:quinone reductase-like Zn-dependent oxidoreductase
MRALILTKANNAESLELIEAPTPEPKKGEVRLKLTSIGLNRGDLLYTQSRYFIKPDSGSRIGFEGAGFIDKIGPDTDTQFSIGDRVGITPMGFDVHAQGCLADYGNYPLDALIQSPAGIHDSDTGAIWMAYFTAWGGLINSGQLTKGEAVVITAASSSVGIAAIQIANMIGAIPIATTTSKDKANALLDCGAKHVITQKNENSATMLSETMLNNKISHYVEKVRTFTSNQGSDLVFDAVAGPMSHALIKGSKREGRIVIHGMLDRLPMDIHAGVIMKRLLTLKGYTVDQTLADKENKALAISAIQKGFNTKRLKPVIAKHFSLDQFDHAFAYLRSNQHLGKIVITP